MYAKPTVTCGSDVLILGGKTVSLFIFILCSLEIGYDPESTLICKEAPTPSMSRPVICVHHKSFKGQVPMGYSIQDGE